MTSSRLFGGSRAERVLLSYRVIVWGLLLFLFFSAAPSAQIMHVRNYSTDDGLPSSQVWSILQDSQGYIWFGTSNGLARYDGRKMTVLGASDGLVSNVVLAMVEDAGKLWIATDNGISCYHDGKFESFSQSNGKEIGIVWSVARFAGHIWFGTKSRGLLRVTPDQDADGHYPMQDFVPSDMLSENSIFSLAADGDGLWIATARGQLYIYDGARFRECAKLFGLAGMSLTHLRYSGDSALWVGTNKYGVFRCNLGALADNAISAPAERYFQDSYIYASAQTGEDMLFGTRYGGLASIERGQQRQWTVENGLCNNQIYAILVDREGSVWLGTNQGVSKIPSRRFLGYLKGEAVTSVCEYGGALWFGTFERGLARLKDGEITRFTKRDGLLSDDQILALAVFQDRLWIGSMGGLNSYDGSAFHAHPGSGRTDSPRGILSLHPAGDCLWIGTVNWAWMYKRTASKDQFTLLSDGSEPSATYFQTVAEDKERKIWFGAPSGAYVYDPMRPEEGMKKAKIGEGSGAAAINCAFSDSEGTLWLGAQTGLIRRGPGEKERSRIFALPASEGGATSSDSNVPSILQSGGRYWLATGMGLVEFDGVNAVRRYTKQDGLLENEATSAASLYRDSLGHIWFATYGGVTEYLPENNIPNTVPPPVLIQKALFDSAPIEEAKGHQFPYHRGTVRFLFAGLSFKDEKDVRYKYKLEGYDKDWSEATKERDVRYTNLDDGRYVFKVIAQNADGCSSAEPATISFEILPPPWKTWWFFLLEVVAAGAILRGLFRFRLKGIEAEKKRLEEVVAGKTRLLTVQAITDGLTGAYNRSWFMQTLRQEILSMFRAPSPDWLSLIILDIDQFKQINDTYGHLVGDHALTSLVEVLRGCTRETDTLARYGGDEFAVILPSTSAEGARAVAEKMREAVECYNFWYKGDQLVITISVGVSVWRCSGELQGDSVQELLEQMVIEADSAMYDVKNSGRNRVVVRQFQPTEIGGQA